MRWKAHERRIAKRLGGTRLGPTGKATMDVETPLFAVECKCWQGSVKRVESALEQAEKASRNEQIPIAVIHTVNRHSDKDLVILRLAEFERLATAYDWYNTTGEHG